MNKYIQFVLINILLSDDYLVVGFALLVSFERITLVRELHCFWYEMFIKLLDYLVETFSLFHSYKNKVVLQLSTLEIRHMAKVYKERSIQTTLVPCYGCTTVIRCNSFTTHTVTFNKD